MTSGHCWVEHGSYSKIDQWRPIDGPVVINSECPPDPTCPVSLPVVIKPGGGRGGDIIIIEMWKRGGYCDGNQRARPDGRARELE